MATALCIVASQQMTRHTSIWMFTSSLQLISFTELWSQLTVRLRFHTHLCAVSVRSGCLLHFLFVFHAWNPSTVSMSPGCNAACRGMSVYLPASGNNKCLTLQNLMSIMWPWLFSKRLSSGGRVGIKEAAGPGLQRDLKWTKAINCGDYF